MAANAFDAARDILQNAGDTRSAQIAALKARQKALQVQRTALAKTIKNENKKRQRIVDKAKTLSTEDLLAVVASRAAAKAKAKAKAKAGGASQRRGSRLSM